MATYTGSYKNTPVSEVTREILDSAIKVVQEKVESEDIHVPQFDLGVWNSKHTTFMTQIEQWFDREVRNTLACVLCDELHADKSKDWRLDRLALEVLWELKRQAHDKHVWKPLISLKEEHLDYDFRPQTVDEVCDELQSGFKRMIPDGTNEFGKVMADIEFVRAHLR